MQKVNNNEKSRFSNEALTTYSNPSTENHAEEVFVVDLNDSLLLNILLSESVSELLDEDANHDESINGKSLRFSKLACQSLDKRLAEAVAHGLQGLHELVRADEA